MVFTDTRSPGKRRPFASPGPQEVTLTREAMLFAPGRPPPPCFGGAPPVGPIRSGSVEGSFERREEPADVLVRVVEVGGYPHRGAAHAHVDLLRREGGGEALPEGRRPGSAARGSGRREGRPAPNRGRGRGRPHERRCRRSGRRGSFRWPRPPHSRIWSRAAFSIGTRMKFERSPTSKRRAPGWYSSR